VAGWAHRSRLGGRRLRPRVRRSRVCGSAPRDAYLAWVGLRERPTLYLTYALAPVVAAFGYWAVLTNLNASGDARPLAYLPLLNPLDLAQAAGLVAVGYWNRILTREGVWLRARKPLLWALLVLCVFGLSALLVQTVHHWTGVAFSWPELSEVGALQTALTIFWTVCGLLLMLFGTRRRQRPVWLIGAALLALFKLFFVDLAQVGTVARIVSFMGVGVLLLLTAYRAPVPPTTDEVPEP